jgi:hypothetical protein
VDDDHLEGRPIATGEKGNNCRGVNIIINHCFELDLKGLNIDLSSANPG